MGLIGGKSGFRTGRDVGLFLMGVVIGVTHLASTFSDPSQISLPVLLTAGGFMGSPYVLNRDERK